MEISRRKKRKDGESTYSIPVKVPAAVSLICLWRAEINSQAESPSKTREEIWRRLLTLQAFKESSFRNLHRTTKPWCPWNSISNHKERPGLRLVKASSRPSFVGIALTCHLWLQENHQKSIYSSCIALRWAPGLFSIMMPFSSWPQFNSNSVSSEEQRGIVWVVGVWLVGNPGTKRRGETANDSGHPRIDLTPEHRTYRHASTSIYIYTAYAHICIYIYV
jgi:hypothetical protein